MDYRYKQLEQDLSALTHLFSDLGSRFTEASKDITTTGVLPSEKLIEQILTVRTKFESVRTAVHSQAGAMLVSPLPKAGELASIHAIGSLLKTAAAAEESKSSAQGEIDRATSILSRVLAITHRETTTFQPLQECLAKVTDLRNAISSAAWPNRHPECDSIIALRHPCTALLNFVENLDTIEDDKWMALETTIAEAYGKPLFVAASRGKLIAQPGSAKAPEPPKATVAAEKPVERKPAPEKLSEKTLVSPPPVAAPPIEKKEAPVAAAVPVAPAAVTPTPQPVPAAAPPAPALTPITSTTIPPRPPAPVAAPPTMVAPPPAAATSLSALANATEPAAERKPAAAPSDNTDKSRKEPRLAQPPQPVRTEATATEQEQTSNDDGSGAIAGDGSQRPQRWGFWRGNR